MTGDLEYELYSDGACRGNPGPGGWGAVVEGPDGVVERSGYHPSTTNNRMELIAACEALEAVPDRGGARITTDSRYVVDGITQWIHGWIRRGWTKADKKPVLNQDLWKRLHGLVSGRKVDWQWVRGHTGHPQNERCDQLANEAMDRQGPRSDG